MKKALLILAGGALLALVFVLGFDRLRTPAEAQRSVTTRFEYAVITGTYQPYPADNPSVVSAAAQVCYIQAGGCQNEEVRAELNLSKFMQDERLENNAKIRGLAVERVTQTAVARSMAKLGAEGWEMITAPAMEFDIYYLNQQGITSVKEGNRTRSEHIWFKRSRQ